MANFKTIRGCAPLLAARELAEPPSLLRPDFVLLFGAIFVWPDLNRFQKSYPEPYHLNWVARTIDINSSELDDIGVGILLGAASCWLAGALLEREGRRRRLASVLLIAGALGAIGAAATIGDPFCAAGYWTDSGCAWE